MPSGSNPDFKTLSFEKVDHASTFSGFHCGIPELDEFIHNELEDFMGMECEAFCVRSGKDVVGMFCLSAHSLFLSDAVKEKMDNGLKPAPEIDSIPYWEYMNSFPAVEIAYLAVDERFQSKGIGSFILEEIMDYVAYQPDNNYDFVTVMSGHIIGRSIRLFLFTKNVASLRPLKGRRTLICSCIEWFNDNSVLNISFADPLRAGEIVSGSSALSWLRSEWRLIEG